MNLKLRQLTITTLLAAMCAVFSSHAAAISLDDKLDRIIQKINDIRRTGNSTAYRINTMKPEGVGDMVDIVHDGLSKMSPDTLAAIEESSLEARVQLDRRNQQLVAFLGPDRQCASGTPCYEFKSRLVSMFEGINDTGMFAQSIIMPDMDPSAVIHDRFFVTFEQTPAAALMPIWVATDEGRMLAEVQSSLQGTFGDRISFMERDCHLYPNVPADQLALADDDRIRFERIAMGLNLLNAVLATVPDEPSPKVAVWGWAGLNFPTPKVKEGVMWIVDRTGKLSSDAAGRLQTQLDACQQGLAHKRMLQSIPGSNGAGTAWERYLELST